MSTWSMPVTWAASQYVVAAQFNNEIRQKLTWLKGALTQLNVTSTAAKPSITPALVGARITAANVIHPYNVNARVAFDTIAWDSDAMVRIFFGSIDNIALDAVPRGVIADYWYVTGQVEWATNATGIRGLGLNDEAFTDLYYAYDRMDASATSSTFQNVAALMTAAVGDTGPAATASLFGFQNGDADGLVIVTASLAVHRISGA